MKDELSHSLIRDIFAGAGLSALAKEGLAQVLVEQACMLAWQ